MLEKELIRNAINLVIEFNNINSNKSAIV